MVLENGFLLKRYCWRSWSGEELLLLANALPGQQRIVGLDLASGMVDAAQQRIASAASPSIRRISAVPCSNLPCDHMQDLPKQASAFLMSKAVLGALVPSKIR